jgi:hypothetical protein
MPRTMLLFSMLIAWLIPAPASAEHHEAGEASADSQEMTHNERVPFQRFWVKSGLSWGDWDQINIAPVNVDHIQEMEWWQKRAGGDLRPQDLGNLADYAKEQFELAFTNGENGTRLGFNAGKGPKTLRLETAIVEVVPTKLLSSVTPGLPRGSAAIEGRVVDSETGEVLAKFADRRSAKHRVVNLKVAWNSGAKEVIRIWAADIAKGLNTGGSATIDDSWDFTLKPW